MNERINELVSQANMEIDPAHPNHNQKVLEKFAKLIVEDIMHELEINGYEDAFDHLNEYFGE